MPAIMGLGLLEVELNPVSHVGVPGTYLLRLSLRLPSSRKLESIVDLVLELTFLSVRCKDRTHHLHC